MKILTSCFLTAFLIINCNASDQPVPRRAAEEEKRLHYMVGEWFVSGEVAESSWGPARSVTGKETGRMRLNNLCLEIEGNLFYGDERHNSLTVIAYSPASKNYTASYLSSIAPLDTYTIELQSSEVGEVWKTTWTEINQGEKYFYRDTRTIIPSENRYSYQVEYSKDQENWTVLYALTGRRLVPDDAPSGALPHR